MVKNSVLLFGFIFLITSCQSVDSNQDKGQEPTEIAQKEQNDNPLPSWNDGATKQAIIDFVEKTTTEGSPDFIPVEDRIATFDNDGNLWSEQPLYFQFLFAVDRLKAMADDHPEWQTQQPFKALLEDDHKTALAGGTKSILEIVMTTHARMTTEEFDATVKEWLATSKHPKTGMHYNEMIYQPMVELLDYLRAHDYKTFIVSGGGIDFMRAWVEEAYGIPPYQVVGSSGKLAFQINESGEPVLMKQAELNFIDDKDGKPIGIHQHIGKRPIIASGNSDGDYQMLQWTTAGEGYPRLGLLLHHTDSVREFAYDRESHVGRLNNGLDDAEKMGWLVIDMKEDWNRVYP
jgi:hypothetical protein